MILQNFDVTPSEIECICEAVEDKDCKEPLKSFLRKLLTCTEETVNEYDEELLNIKDIIFK